MNVFSLLILVALCLTSIAAVRLSSPVARSLAGGLCVVVGGSFSILGLSFAAPAVFLGGAAHLATGIVVGLGRYRYRLTLIGALFAVSLSGLILVADAWDRWPVTFSETTADRLRARAEILRTRGGIERVRLAMVSDVPEADFAALGEAALAEDADAVVLLDSDASGNAARERLARWTSQTCGIPLLIVDPSSSDAAASLRPYLYLVLAGAEGEPALREAANLLDAHRFSVAAGPNMGPAVSELARELGMTLLVLPGDDLTRTTKNELHIVHISSGTAENRGGLMEATPYGLVVRPMQSIAAHREFASGWVAKGRMLLLCVQGRRVALGALLLLCTLAFAIPLTLLSRPTEQENV